MKSFKFRPVTSIALLQLAVQSPKRVQVTATSIALKDLASDLFCCHEKTVLFTFYYLLLPILLRFISCVEKSRQFQSQIHDVQLITVSGTWSRPQIFKRYYMARSHTSSIRILSVTVTECRRSCFG